MQTLVKCHNWNSFSHGPQTEWIHKKKNIYIYDLCHAEDNWNDTRQLVCSDVAISIATLTKSPAKLHDSRHTFSRNNELYILIWLPQRDQCRSGINRSVCKVFIMLIRMRINVTPWLILCDWRLCWCYNRQNESYQINETHNTNN